MARPENKIAAAGVAVVDDFVPRRDFAHSYWSPELRGMRPPTPAGQLYQRRTIQPRRASPAPKIGKAEKTFGNADKIILGAVEGAPRSPNPANAAVGKRNRCQPSSVALTTSRAPIESRISDSDVRRATQERRWPRNTADAWAAPSPRESCPL